jgi:anti-sigma regulatory factor (Ser/Thr protein kinase)
VLTLDVPLEPAGFEAAQARIEAFLEQGEASARVRYKVRLVLDEMVANLQLHARFEGGRAAARVEVRWDGQTALLFLEDTAAPFDPRATADPTAPPSLHDDRVGGLGLSLVRKMAEIRAYERLPEGWNRTEFSISDA